MKKVNNFFKTILNSNLKIVFLLIGDILFAFLSFWLANKIMFFKISIDNTAYPAEYINHVVLIGASSIVITIAMLLVWGNYRAIWRYASVIDLFRFVLAYFSILIILLVLKFVLTLSTDIEFWAPIIIIYLLLSALFSGIIRLIGSIYHYVKYISTTLNHNKNKKGPKRTIVIGAGYTGSVLVNRFINNLHEGFIPVAIIDDDVEKIGRKLYGIPIVGGMNSLDKAVKKFQPEAFVIAIMSLTKSQLRNIYNACLTYKLPIKVAPQIADASAQLKEQAISLTDIKMESLLGRDEFEINHDLINSSIRDKVVLVTGGAGSIGSELCRQVLEFGCKHLIIYDQHENGMFFLNQEFKDRYDTSKYTLVIGTVRETDKLKTIFSEYKPDTVFHAAAYKHVPMMELSPTEAIKTNVFGTLNVIECAEEGGASKFVLVSTDKAVNPSNVMGASKRIAEMVVETKGKTSKMNMAAVRFGNVLGSNGSVIPIFLEQIKNGGPITLTDRYIKRYFMSIPEAVKLVLQTGAFANNGEIFVLDMGEPVYIYDLACDLIRLSGLTPEKDIEIRVTGLRPGEKMFEELRYDNESVDTTIHNGVFVNKMEDIDTKEFNANLKKLFKAAFNEDDKETTDIIFNIVPSIYRNKNN